MTLAACTAPRPRAVLPAAPYVAVLSGEMPPPIDQVSRHSWIIVQHPEGPPRRYEIHSSGGPDPFDNYAAGDVILHGVIEGTAEEIQRIDDCLRDATREYHARYPTYLPIPGPNSNTYVAELGRSCSLGVELPATAIGRDYVGFVGAALTESGTGIQLGTFPLGLRLGLREGVSIQLFGLSLGVHFFPLGIDVPVNPGRVGFGREGHVWRDPNRPRELAFPDEAATTGAASVILYTEGLVTVDPARGRDLEGMFALGMSGRGVYGEYVGYAAGLDLEIAATTPIGLAGRAHLYPVGFGVFVSPTGFVSILGGVGASGVIDRFPSALELPVEVRLEVDIASRARVTVFAREAFGAFEPLRTRGFLDLGELTMGLRARFGESFGSKAGAHGSGYFFGVERREIGETAMIGMLFGSELEAGVSSR